jgi:CHASE3 domain sensor protein
VLAELDEPIEADRAAIGAAANQALKQDPGPELQDAVADAVTAMEAALRRRRLRAQL